MKIDDIKIGERYAVGSENYPNIVKVTDIKLMRKTYLDGWVDDNTGTWRVMCKSDSGRESHTSLGMVRMTEREWRKIQAARDERRNRENEERAAFDKIAKARKERLKKCPGVHTAFTHDRNEILLKFIHDEDVDKFIDAVAGEER